MFSFSSCGNKEEVADNRSKVKVTVKQADSCFLGFGINFSGRIEPVKQSVVSTRLMGQVSRIFVKEGQPVNQGDFDLLRIEAAATRDRARVADPGLVEPRHRFSGTALLSLLGLAGVWLLWRRLRPAAKSTPT